MHGAGRAHPGLFPALIDLQPLRWCSGDLLCAPWLAPELTATALARCPLPWSAVDPPAVVPDSRAALVAGWYRRSDRHAPAPVGVAELVQVAGEGFGAADHPTTALALAALDALPAAPALDVGCGSGLLAQAWSMRRKGDAHGIDADPAAVTQARRSAAAAGSPATFAHGYIERLDPQLLADRVLLANLPSIAQEALRARIRTPPPAIVLGGTGPNEAAAVVAFYRGLGMRRIRTARAGRWECTALVRA